MHKISWTPYVFLRYAIFLIAGIVFEIHISFTLSSWIAINLSAFLLYVIAFVTFPKHLKFSFQDLFGILAFFFLFSTGGLVTHFKNEKNDRNHILKVEKSITWYKGQIVSEVLDKENWFKTEIEISQIRSNNGWEKASGRVLIYQPKKDSLRKFEYGDVVLIKGSPSELRPPDHPQAFDYKRYLSFKQIFHQHFLNHEYSVVEKGRGKAVIAFSLFLRKKGEMLFRKNINGEKESSLASALILGIKHDLDSELKTAYSRIGVIHVLAVSGMHVALIFKMLLLGFGRIKGIKRGHIVFGVISLFIIWLFAFVTGLSASVLRAVVMFSFLLIGQMFQQQRNIYNSLAMSAFCLLIYDPFLIMDIGFQLSYLAVFGIVYFYPRIYNLLEFETFELDFLWKTTTITLAAQIATTPLSIYYFQQFPTYFLFSNLIIIPLTSGILYLGVGLLSFYRLPYLPELIGLVIKGMVWLCNKIVLITNDFPLSAITGLLINPLETFLIYIAIGLMLAFLYFKKLIYMWSILTVVFIFSFSQLYRTITKNNAKSIVIYKNQQSSELELFEAGSPILTKDSVINSPQNKVFPELKFFVWKGKSIVLIDSPLKKVKFHENEIIPIDLLILRNNSVEDFNELCQVFKIDQIVFDGSNSRKVSRKLLVNAAAFDLRIHSLEDNGPFQLNF